MHRGAALAAMSYLSCKPDSWMVSYTFTANFMFETSWKWYLDCVLVVVLLCACNTIHVSHYNFESMKLFLHSSLSLYLVDGINGGREGEGVKQ